MNLTINDRKFINQKIVLVNHSAAKRGAMDQIKPDEWVNKLQSHGLCCHYCGESLTLKQITVDHATPLSRGGRNVIDNAVPACSTCNRNKHTRLASDFTPTPSMTKEERSQRISISIPGDIFRHLDKTARKRGWSRNAVVKLAISKLFGETA